MASSDEKFKKEIQRLKKELEHRDRDLEVYKSEVSQLNSQIEKLITNVEKQLEVATKVHGLLVPSELPEIQGFEFSSKYIASGISGGDYFDIFRLGNKSRFGILMASSSGHSMAALFLSVLIRVTAQIGSQSRNTASEIQELLCGELSKSIESADSVSIMMAVVDRKKLEIEICNNGEVFIWSQPSNAPSPELLDLRSDPISKGYAENAKTFTRSLNGGDRLVFLSRGMVELTNSSGESFGVNRIQEIIETLKTGNCHELRNELIFQARKFSETDELSRDLTVIVMDVRERVIKLAST